MSIQGFHAAAKAVEADGIGGFRKAAEIVGAAAAFALVVAHLRRGCGSVKTSAADPDIDRQVNGYLVEDLPYVYAVLSQRIAAFYSERWYCFDNFSHFTVKWHGKVYPTAEHAYQSAKFINADGSLIMNLVHDGEPIAEIIRKAPSAHEAKKLGRSFDYAVRSDWEEVRSPIMEEILRAKREQHEYVQKELAASKGMLILEDSSSDAFWGRGPNWDGRNQLGKLWMKIRDEQH